MTSRIPLTTLLAALVAASASARPASDSLVLVEGGPFVNTRSSYFGRGLTVADFFLGRHEVTQREWTAVMGSNPSAFVDDDRPVDMVSWYEAVEYCNRRSELEGYEPCYTIRKDIPDELNSSPTDDMKWTVIFLRSANGYRLPTEAEWEYAAGGGRLSRSYVYSGGHQIDKVAWYWQNSGEAYLRGMWNWPALEQNKNRTHPVGTKSPNELGLHDMSGNVREWCWDWFGDAAADAADGSGGAGGSERVWKGGGWMGGDFCCEPAYRSSFEPHGRGSDQGFRVARNR